MFMRPALFALLCGAALPAGAGTLSFSGTLPEPNGVALVSFELASTATLVLQSWGYGGSAAAPGGTNAAGVVIAGGGLDSYISLFAGSGPAATFVASNDDGPCPPATAAPQCYDAGLLQASLPAGSYTLALTQPGNFSFAENLGSGTLGDGFIGLEADFHGRMAAWAVDIESAALVPEPGTAVQWSLGLLGLAMVFGRRFLAQGVSR